MLPRVENLRAYLFTALRAAAGKIAARRGRSRRDPLADLDQMVAPAPRPVEIGLSARIVDKNGKVIASRLLETSDTFDKVEPVAAVSAFDAAFARIAKELVGWTVGSV